MIDDESVVGSPAPAARWIAAAVVLLSLGCGSATSETPGNGGTGAGQDSGSTEAEAGTCSPNPTTGELPCEVAVVLQSKCQTCHQDPPQNHAPWPILTYEDTQMPYGTQGKRRWQRMAEVVEPGSIPQMPLAPAPPLTQEELDTLRAWFRNCAPPAPAGEGCDPGE